MVKLKYVGDGSFYPGVPASDHEQSNEAHAERLVFSGLYEYEDKKQQAAAVKAREKVIEEDVAAEQAVTGAGAPAEPAVEEAEAPKKDKDTKEENET